MKIKFTLQDSISKILTTCEKIPSYKLVRIYIPDGHEFFDHQRRGKQLQELIETHNLQVEFICKNFDTKAYFDRLWLPTILVWASRVSNARLMFRNALTMQSFFSPGAFKKLNPFIWLILGTQLAVIGGIIYMFWWILSPNAHVTITPAYRLDTFVYNFLLYPPTYDTQQERRQNIPLVYTTGSFTHTTELTLPVEDVSYEVTNARIEVELMNTLPTPYSFLANTVFTTRDGILFSSPEEIFLPWADDNGQPGRVRIELTAHSFQENGLPIGDRGNIRSNTRLYIQKFDYSMVEELIYARPLRLLSPGETTTQWVVQDIDLVRFEVRIQHEMTQNMKDIIFQQLRNSPYIVLPFDDMMKVSINQWTSNQRAGASATSINGTVEATFSYAAITKQDLKKAILQYLDARPQEKLTLHDIDWWRIDFLTKRNDPDRPERILAPTALPIIWRYNLEDHTYMLEDMRQDIVGKSREEATRTLLQHPAVWDVSLRLRPPRYTTLPVVPSRISISIK